MVGPARTGGLRGAVAVAVRAAAALAALAPAQARALEPDKAISQYVHQAWGSDEGLPQNSVFAVTQTRDGYLWVGTEEGLSRFDGVRFTSFDKDVVPCLVDNWVSSLVEGPDGALWMGTWHGGIARLKDGRFDCFGTRQGLVSDEIVDIAPAPDGVWLASANRGLSFFDPTSGRVTRHPIGATAGDAPAPNVVALERARDGSLWIATDGGGLHHRRRDGSVEILTTADGLVSDSLTSLAEGPDGTIWVGSAVGLARVRDGNAERFRPRRGPEPLLVTRIGVDRRGTVWLGTEDGLRRVHGDVVDAYSVRDGLSSPIVRAVFEDREGNVWFGTDGGGLHRLSDGVFTAYTRAQGLADDHVWAVYAEAGSVWIGTQSGGINRLHDGAVTTLSMEGGQAEGAVRAIFRASNGTLWFGTRQGGLARLEGDRLVPTRTAEPRCGSRVIAIAEDGHGTLWIGTKGAIAQDGLICRLEGDQLIPYGASQGGLDDQITVMLRARDGRLLIGGGRGLYVLRDGRLERTYTVRDGLSSNVVSALHEDDDGTLWIGTGTGGINRMRRGVIRYLTTSAGLLDDRVHAILDDGRGFLWMSSNRGIFRVARREMEDALDGKARKVTSVAYSRADGMGSTECNGSSQYAGWRAPDGALWFATMKGAVVVRPDRLHVGVVPPPVLIERLRAGDAQFAPGAPISLPPEARTIELDYTATSLTASDRIRFRYMLEGFESEWVEAGVRRSAFYTNLPPGDYRFRVSAANRDGVWNQTGASIEFSVQPHIYQTRWFYLLCLAAAIALGWALHRLRVGRLRAREKGLEARVDERTRQIEEAAAALRASEAFASAIVDHVADGIIAFRQDGTITSWNAAAASIFHYTEEEAIGHDAHLVRLGRPAADALRTRVLGDALRKDGSSVPVEVHATRAEVHGEPVSIWLVRDLTEARQAEAKVAAIQSQLIEISRRAGMAQVATSVLHSVGNSLTSLSVSASVILTAMRQSKLGSLTRGVNLLAQTQAVSPGDDRARHLPGFLAKVTEALQEEQAEAIVELEGMERTIEQIEAVVRSQQSRAQVGGVAESIVLNELVEDALRFQRGRCETAHVGLLVDFAELPRVRVDRARVLEILLNLLTNAREAVERAPPSDLRHVLVRTRRVDRDHVAIDVIDTGVGIPAEHLVDVFAQGYTTKRDGDGFGLHSSACIATELGGGLQAHSEGTGQGACFTLVLPMHERAASAEPAVEAM
jgi:PAS domain S-box-containing protein